MNHTLSLPIFALILALPSCMVSVPPTTQATYASLQEKECIVRPDQVYLFFEGEAGDFSYQKLGVVEIRGTDEASLENLLDHLRYAAWQQCADGLIHVKKEYRTIEGDLDVSDESIDIRSEVIYSGIAVCIDKTPQFYEQYGRQPNTEFIYKTETRLEEEEREVSAVSTFQLVEA